MKNNKLYTEKDIKDYFKELEEWEKNHPILSKFKDAYYRLKRFFNEFPYEVKTKYQRIIRGWADSDVWNLDYFLSKLIVETVSHLKKYHNGHPCSLTEKKWEKKLLKIIKAFKYIKEIGEGKRTHYAPKMNKNFQKEYNCLTKKENKEMKEGMKLFMKYYFSLWD